LIRAAKLINKQLVIIGDAVSGFETYHQACLQEGQGMTRFIPAMDQDHGLLASAYAACDLYVLPAWFETPGMVALESILAGANVASTTGGSTRDYFKDDVDYFDPAKPDSIANAIQKGLKRSVNPEFKKRVMDEFTWEPIAQNTIQYYKEFL
ncbi:MAG: glycosyltransferase involved in cell wall biosynthesis, partial [Candidatus Omnitrophota bacterium]